MTENSRYPFPASLAHHSVNALLFCDSVMSFMVLCPFHLGSALSPAWLRPGSDTLSLLAFPRPAPRSWDFSPGFCWCICDFDPTLSSLITAPRCHQNTLLYPLCICTSASQRPPGEPPPKTPAACQCFVEEGTFQFLSPICNIHLGSLLFSALFLNRILLL